MSTTSASSSIMLNKPHPASNSQTPSSSASITEIRPIKPEPTASAPLNDSSSSPVRPSEDHLFRSISIRRKSQTSISPTQDQKLHSGGEESVEIERLLSKIFGQNRQAVSEEEKTRHVGVIFKDLTVKGGGLGASLQPTNSDFVMGPLRGIKALFTGKLFRKAPIRTIINSFTGCIKPSEMLLVLGRPGSGCSTFLKVIGNQRSGFESITGEVTYGGTDWTDMAKNFRGEVLYNPEEDLHYATLTVKDTIRFALQTRTPGKESRADGETRGAYVEEFLRVVSKLFWIEHTLDTRIGNAIIRGVSGGEKKRVSIAEAMVTKASCQCWDNSTKGLDSSTAMEYVSSLRSLTNMARISTLVALYQAGESLYGLFDKVLVIDQGRCAYFGPTEDAKQYFEDLGFVCPPRWTTADFLTSVTNPHERHVQPGWEARIPRTAEEFEAAYLCSTANQKNLTDITDFEDSIDQQREARALETSNATKRKNYTISFQKQVMACTSRQFKVMLGDRFSLCARWIGVALQSVIIGSLFYELPANARGVFPRGGILFFTLLMNALLAMAELGIGFQSRPILMKHKAFSFYRPSAYAIAQVMADIPLCLMQVLIWGVITYFMSNLRRTASHFFIFILITFIMSLSMYSFFRMIAAWSNSLDSATQVTGVAIQALIVYTGYLIPPVSMHPWFAWLRWINPVQYSFEVLMANEFDGLNIECVPPFLVPAGGPGVTPENQGCLLRGNQPGSTIVQGADYIFQQYTYTRAHLWRNIGIVIGFWIFFAVLTAVGLEIQRPYRDGAAVTVFVRGETPEQVKKALDAGAPPPADEEMAEKDLTTTTAAEASKEDRAIDQVAKNDTVFTWQNVTYKIPTKTGEKILLNNVSGYVRPGKLTALMGESGAGKTTLLNTLAQRISFGKVTGTFLVNGRPLPLSFQRATGFAEQMDVHEPTTTVREALRFSALLRQPKEVPQFEKFAYVENILQLLEMEDIAGATVGSPGNGLNEEQRKRLTIAVELAGKPELLMFLDEPTSGLDSGAAFNVVRFLRKLADAGQAILCTVHQPSAVLFEHFDELILLKSGGAPVYCGPLGQDSQAMIEYFEANGAPKCPQHKNPAEYMLEAIGAGDPNRREKDWGQIWTNSDECRQRIKEIEMFIQDRSQMNSSQLADDRQFAMPWNTQVTTVVKRTFISHWRSPQYITGIFAVHAFTGLFNAFTFYQLGNSGIDMQSRLFTVFMLLTISPPLMQQLQPKFLGLRDLFIARENSSKIYHWSAFVISAIVVEIPYRLVAGTVYFVAWYFPIGFSRDASRVGYVWLMMMLFEFYYLGLGQLIAAFCPNELLASLLLPIFFLFVVSFCGIVVPYASIPYFWRSWMYWASPFTYMLEGFLGVLTHDVPIRCDDTEYGRFAPPQGMSCQEYVMPFIQQAGGYVREMVRGQCEFCQFQDGSEFARSFNLQYDNRWRDIAIVGGYIVFNFICVFAFIWLFLGRYKRFMGKK